MSDFKQIYFCTRCNHFVELNPTESIKGCPACKNKLVYVPVNPQKFNAMTQQEQRDFYAELVKTSSEGAGQTNSQPESKPSCLGRVLKISAFALAAAVVAGLLTAEPSAPTVSATVTPVATVSATASPAPTAAPSPTSTKSSAQPGLSGSHAHDVTISLKYAGFPEPETTISYDQSGNAIFQHTANAMLDGCFLTYNIISNEAHQISYAVFNAAGESDFLPFCATMPYDQADPNTASAWVAEHLHTEATTSIGDADFAIYPNQNGGAMLTITAHDYVSWSMEQIGE